MQNVIVGTSGHVDHGKTCLIKALSGIDTDRLKEEQKRGITIELGFANLPNDEGLHIAPGSNLRHVVPSNTGAIWVLF